MFCMAVRRLSGSASWDRRLEVRVAVRLPRTVRLVRRAGNSVVGLGSLDHRTHLVPSLWKDGKERKVGVTITLQVFPVFLFKYIASTVRNPILLKAKHFLACFRMFVAPLYSGAVIVPSLLMNRRRNENEVRRTCLGTFEVTLQFFWFP